MNKLGGGTCGRKEASDTLCFSLVPPKPRSFGVLTISLDVLAGIVVASFAVATARL